MAVTRAEVDAAEEQFTAAKTANGQAGAKAQKSREQLTQYEKAIQRGEEAIASGTSLGERNQRNYDEAKANIESTRAETTALEAKAAETQQARVAASANYEKIQGQFNTQVVEAAPIKEAAAVQTASASVEKAPEITQPPPEQQPVTKAEVLPPVPASTNTVVTSPTPAPIVTSENTVTTADAEPPAKVAAAESAANEQEKSDAENKITNPNQEPVDNWDLQGTQAVDKPRPNPLFDYADYTYGISMHVIPPEKYNKMMNTPGYVYTPQWPDEPTTVEVKGVKKVRNPSGTVLIASGGRRGLDFMRHPQFQEDFYFDSLKFSTVVGMNARSKNSNVLDISFTIIEPYGVTLLDRLLEVAYEIEANSWMQIPYLLEIDFFGNTELGEPLTPIPNLTKRIPFKLIACKVKVTNKGAEYQIQAVPFNHQAFTESSASTPAFFEVQATKVSDFFSSTGSAGQADSISAVNKAENERQETLKKDIKEDAARAGDPKAAEAREKESAKTHSDVINTPYIVGSYTAALNSYQKQLVNDKVQLYPEIYAFEFHKDIGDSPIVFPPKTPAQKAPMADPVKAIRAKAGVTNAGVDTSKEGFNINAGTNALDVINLVMRSTDYIRKQITDPAVDAKTATSSSGQEIANKLKKPINWWKVTSKVELSKFDVKKGVYSKKITYYVYPYEIHNTKFPDAPKSEPKLISKEYHYMYTGKNDSILSLDLDFDTMFYTVMTSSRSKVQETTNQQKPTDPTVEDKATSGSSKPGFQDNQIRHVSGQADMSAAASPDSKGVLVNDFYKSALSSSRGDMISVDLKIVGDPEYIKQDDTYFNPGTNPDQGKKNHTDKDGTILFDEAERYALLTLNTPVDIDETTGLMRFGSQLRKSGFSGIYRIVDVNHTLAQGQFTQNLHMVRIFDPLNPNPSDAQRSDDIKTIAESKEPKDNWDLQGPKTQVTPLSEKDNYDLQGNMTKYAETNGPTNANGKPKDINPDTGDRLGAVTGRIQTNLAGQGLAQQWQNTKKEKLDLMKIDSAKAKEAQELKDKLAGVSAPADTSQLSGIY